MPHLGAGESTVIGYVGANNIGVRAPDVTMNGNARGRQQVAAAVQNADTFDAKKRADSIRDAGTLL